MQQSEVKQKLMTASELAKILGIQVYSLQRFCRLGYLPFVQIGRKRYFTPEMVSHILRDRSEEIRKPSGGVE